MSPEPAGEPRLHIILHIIPAYLSKLFNHDGLLQLGSIGSVGVEPDAAKTLVCALPIVWP